MYYILFYSQYPSLWSVSNSTISPVSQSGGIANGLGPQYLRASPAHYPSLSHGVHSSSSGSPLYDHGATTEITDNQYEITNHSRLSSPWTAITPNSM